MLGASTLATFGAVGATSLSMNAQQPLKELAVIYDEFIGQPFDYVITVCDNAKQNCPIFPDATRRIHWSVEDPAAVSGREQTKLQAFREARDELRERLGEFIRTATVAPNANDPASS